MATALASPTETAVTPPPSYAPVPVAAAPATGFGASTRAWTSLQTSGAAASSEPRPLPGEAAKNTYERYLKSFAHPIPEKFERESFTSDGGR